ncbi:MAG: pyrroline-5-carboxylate reductase [Planctomyces sp.]|nr:pyrroline-5-carboxylate reductase [Planctomyces sp.]
MFDPEQVRIAFIGTGQMATALAAGFSRTQISADRISGSDPSADARKRFAESVGEEVHLASSPASVVHSGNIIVLAVKPQVMDSVLKEISPLITPGHLVVSVAAGITLERMASALPSGARLIRVMPNTPCLTGSGACALSRGIHATDADVALIAALLTSVGCVEIVSEGLLDAVTGLSGSGPAYVFQFIEALSDGGVRMGLPRATATRLAAQTVLGAAEMVLQSQQHPAALKDGVTSPGGTTIAGLHELERGGLRAAVMNAVQAATLRSQELGRTS